MKLSSIFVAVSLAANFVAAGETDIFSTFKESDIKNFLRDQNVHFDEGTDYKQLTKLAEEQFEKLRDSDIEYNINGGVQDEQQVLNLATNARSNLKDIFPSNWDYFKPKESQDKTQYPEVKDWVFASWSVSNLQRFLKNNKIKFNKGKDTKYDLIELAKSHWNDITNKYSVSGNYAGDWLYEGWSLDDIKGWLTDYEIEFDPKSTKDSLLHKIKESNFLASQSVLDSKKSLFDSFHLPELNIFQNDGSIDSSFIDTWSYSQLREWLYYNGVINTKPTSELKDLNIEKLRNLAKANEKYIQIDIQNWIKDAKSKASPYVSKTPSNWDDKIQEIINSSFLLGIENWSKERLQNFLKVRDVKFSKFATKPQLIKLVQSVTNVPVKTKQEVGIATNWLYDSWSTEALRDWVKEKGLASEGSRQDLLDTVVSYYDDIKADSSKFVTNQIENYSPKIQDVEAYFQDSLKATKEKIEDSSNSLADVTLLNAYKKSIEFFNRASQVIQEQYKSTNFDLSEALGELQAQSLEYSKTLADQSKVAGQDIKDSAEAVAAAATSYANDLTKTLFEAYQRGAPVVLNYAEDTQNVLKYYGESAAAKIEQAVEVAKGSAAEAGSQLKDNYDANKPIAEEALRTAYESALEYGETAVEYGKVAAEAAHEYSKNVAQGAVEYGKDANEAVQSVYADYKPSVDQAVREGYDYLFQLYSNSDLTSYLESFGYSRDLLYSFSRDQLVKLSQYQADLFYGNSKTKWEKSITDIFYDSANGFQQKLGLKPKPKSIWSKLKSIL